MKIWRLNASLFGCRLACLEKMTACLTLLRWSFVHVDKLAVPAAPRSPARLAARPTPIGTSRLNIRFRACMCTIIWAG